MGREVHTVRQAAQQETLPSYRAEVTIRQQFLVDGYTVHVQGRIDGLYEEYDTLIVEEIKSLLVPPEHFNAITLGDYPTYEQQLTLYVHLLRQQHTGPVCVHLVLVNLADNTTKVLLVVPEDTAGE